MKNFIKMTSLGLYLLVAACSQKQTAKQLLQDKALREEIMTTISNDTAMAVEMYTHLHSSEVSKNMMPVVCTMMNGIITSEALEKDTSLQNMVLKGAVHIMEHDSAQCDKTCTWMNENQEISKMLHKQEFKPLPGSPYTINKKK